MGQGMDAGQRYPASATVVALVIQLPSACLRGARPGMEEGGGAGTREGQWRGLKGPRGPTLLEAEVPRDNCGQRPGGPETGPGVEAPWWGLVLEGGVSCEAGVLSGSLRKIPASPTLF